MLTDLESDFCTHVSSVLRAPPRVSSFDCRCFLVAGVVSLASELVLPNDSLDAAPRPRVCSSI